MNVRKTLNFMALSLVLLSAIMVSTIYAQETVVIQDSLQGGTVGVRVGGTLTAEGFKPGIGTGHILYDVPSQVVNGYIQFEMKGFSPSLIQDAERDADNGFFGMYDGRGIREPIQYFDDFKYNYFRWNFHYRQNRSAFKSVINCAAPTAQRLNSTYAVFPGGGDLRDWFSEPTGINYSMNTTSWYTVKCEWRNKAFKVSINGTTVWSTSGPYDYAPIDFKIWLGSAPGYGDKYVQLVPNMVFRNFKLVRYGTAPVSTSAPRITSSPVTSGSVGQLYSYDVNATGSPTPTYSLTTAPSGMTINSSTGLIQWTPPTQGSFAVTVKAANGISPDATQSFSVNVTAGLGTVCPTSMVSYWKLDETSGSTYADIYGGNRATSFNIPAPVAGQVNGAQYFNGTSNGLSAPRIAGYDFPAGSSFTLEAWIKRDAGAYIGEEVIVERRSSTSPLSLKLGFNSTRVEFSARSNTGELKAVTGTTSLYDGTWHHVVGVRDATRSELRIYVDGMLENTAPATYGSGFTSPTAGVTMGWRAGSPGGKYFLGAIDEVAIYRGALSASTIVQHYQNGLQDLEYCDLPIGQ